MSGKLAMRGYQDVGARSIRLGTETRLHLVPNCWWGGLGTERDGPTRRVCRRRTARIGWMPATVAITREGWPTRERGDRRRKRRRLHRRGCAPPVCHWVIAESSEVARVGRSKRAGAQERRNGTDDSTQRRVIALAGNGVS